VNLNTRRAALYAIGTIALLASMNAAAHSYAGLYDWAVHHRLGGWQAMSWPAEIDVFLAVGELALYVAYLDGWPTRQRVWPWSTAVTGLAVSVAGNIGHIQADPGQPVIVADRLTAAASPLAAFAGLAIGLLVLKMTRQQASNREMTVPSLPHLVLAADQASGGIDSDPEADAIADRRSGPMSRVPTSGVGRSTKPDLLLDARAICRAAAERGEQLSQRALARQLRGRGHSFPNDQLCQIAETTRLVSAKAA